MSDEWDAGTVQQGLQPKRRRGPGRPFTGRDDPRRNSGGRRATPISAALARLLTEDDAERIASMAIGRAMAGEPWFVQFVTERLEGKAIARTESGEPGQFVDLEDITIEQLRKALKLVP